MKIFTAIMGSCIIAAFVMAGSSARGDSEIAYCIDQCNDEYYVCVESVKNSDEDKMTGKTAEECEQINQKCKMQCGE